MGNDSATTALTRDAVGPRSASRGGAAVRAETQSASRVNRARDTLFRRSLAIADIVSLIIAFGLSAGVAGGTDVAPLSLAAIPLFVIIVKARGLYDRDEHLLHKSTLDEVPALFGCATAAALFFWLANGAVVHGELSRGQVVGAWLGLFVLLVALRPLARAVANYRSSVERCLVVGPASAAEYIREKLALTSSVKAELVGAIDPSAPRLFGESVDELSETIAQLRVERVILSADPHGRDELLFTIRELKSAGVKVSVLPEASRVAGSSVEIDHLHGITLLGMRRFEITRSSRLIKRAFDLSASLLGLLVVSPLLIVVAAAIRVESPGPILFRQSRVGRHGHEFTMLKFRSMVDEAEQLKDELEHLNQAATGLFKIHADPRVTRVGKLIRRFQIDELPQILNVIKGEMSLVGPRPLIPSEDQKIEGWYRRRLDVPPGITGHWQILGSSNRIPIDEMVKLDYLYTANWSLWGDIRLLLRTIPFVAGRRGV